MEVVQCEQELERISKRTVEQTDVLFVTHVGQTISQDRVQQPFVEQVTEVAFSRVVDDRTVGDCAKDSVS